VLNGVEDPQRVPLLPVPLGTANMLARELGQRAESDDVVTTLESGYTTYFDMGLATYTDVNGARASRRFLLVASAGFDAWVTREVARRRGRRLGYLGYAGPIFHTLLTYRCPRLSVSWNSPQEIDINEDMETKAAECTEKAAMAVVCNCANYGGLFSLSPQADCTSGRADLVLLRNGGWLALLASAWSAFRKRLQQRSDTVQAHAQRIRIESDTSEPVEIDGDFVGTTPLEIAWKPGAVAIRRGADAVTG